MWWLYSVWVKPVVILITVLAIWGLWKWGQAGWEKAARVENAARAAEVAVAATKRTEAVRYRAEEIVRETRSQAVVVDLVADPRISGWLDRVFGDTPGS